MADDTINALGFVEVRGLAAAIETADAMLKCAQVRLLRQLLREPVQTTLIVEGSLGACSAAVDAGRSAAQRMDALVSSLVLGRPANDTAQFVLKLAEAGSAPFAPPTPAQPAPPAKAPRPLAVPAAAVDAAPSQSLPSPPAKAAKPTPSDAQLLAALAGLPGGYGAQSLARRVGGNVEAVRARLEALCADGQLAKRGNRYRLAPKDGNQQ